MPLIVEEIASLPEWEPGTTVYVPLAIGDHIDHQLTFAAGQLLAARGIPVFAYEDYPYAIHSPQAAERRIAAALDAGQVGPETLVPIAAGLERRVAAILAYRTQVPVIIRFTDHPGGAVMTHTERVGGALGPAERYWPVRPAHAAK